MSVLRNPKHERFAQEIVNGRSLVDAYKAAGFKPDFRNAKRLRDRKDIGQRVDQILTDRERRATLSTERAIEKAAITKADVIGMLIEDRALARANVQASAAIRAAELGPSPNVAGPFFFSAARCGGLSLARGRIS